MKNLMKRTVAVIMAFAMIVCYMPVMADAKVKNLKPITIEQKGTDYVWLTGYSTKAKWKTSNSKVVKIVKKNESYAKIKGLKAGTATITAETKNKTYKCKVTVKSIGKFKNNTLETKVIKIKITDYSVIQPGETGNEYGEKPIIAFWYEITNKTSEEIDPTDWVLFFDAIQDNNKNAVNKLSLGSSPDDSYLDSDFEKIKKGGTVSSVIAYELDDLKTPVTLVASDAFASGNEVGKQNFDVKSKAGNGNSGNSTTSEDDDWDSGFSFKNNVLDLTILQLKITDCKVFQPKESINTSDNPVVAFYFDLKNIDFEGDLKLARAFVEFFVPTQGDDVLELAVLSLSDDIFINSVTDSVGIGEIKSGAVAFELKDANTPVVLEAYNYETGKSYGTQTFNTKSN